ncbi:GPP34 family phosphoprotein [Streptomyces sp. ODS28]|uniref:GOLPH3/VPS74 family protein n=1 Tax=Streptomyces sp. ODS28 TaxID=3136688 RepID=UPI0031E67C30
MTEEARRDAEGAGEDGRRAEAPGLSLPEELLLLAVNPRGGRILVNPSHLRWGLAAAALVELEAQGRVSGEGGRIAVLRPDPTGRQELDAALAALPSPPGTVRVKRWLGRYGRRAEQSTAKALAARGALSSEEVRVLGVFPRLRHRVLDPALRARRLEGMAAAAKSGFPGRRSRALAALLKATRVAGRLGVPRAVGREMRPLVREFWQAEAVRRKVSESRSAAAGGGGG